MFQRNGWWWMRVWTPTAASRRVPIGTQHEATAKQVVAWVDEVKARLDRHGVLAAVVRGDVRLDAAYSMGEVATAHWLDAEAEAEQDQAVTDADLDRWQMWVVGKGRRAKSAADYRLQVETLWPAPRLQSWLQPRTIMMALETLPVSEPTKGRYRAALASLCEWLLRQGRLEVNPMPSVPGFAQSAARLLWYSDADALRLLEALPAAQRGIEATMWACGWEWAAVERATVADFDLAKGTAFARGTKTASRQRLTVVTCPEALPMIADALRHKLPAARVWDGIRNDRTLKIHQGVCRELGLPVTTLHDWRHTFAVRELKKGRSLQFVAQMLGHGTTAQVQARYGRYVLSAGELEMVAEQSLKERVG
jgi:integrase